MCEGFCAIAREQWLVKSKDRQTGRSIQTSLFIGSLMKEMGKLAKSKGRLVVSADAYLSKGCSREETEELLAIDGFDRDMVDSYLSSTASAEQVDHEKGRFWGFEIRGSCGDKVTHEDLDIEIRAATRDEAVGKLKAIMDEEKDAGLDKIVDVFEI